MQYQPWIMAAGFAALLLGTLVLFIAWGIRLFGERREAATAWEIIAYLQSIFIAALFLVGIPLMLNWGYAYLRLMRKA